MSGTVFNLNRFGIIAKHHDAVVSDEETNWLVFGDTDLNQNKTGSSDRLDKAKEQEKYVTTGDVNATLDAPDNKEITGIKSRNDNKQDYAESAEITDQGNGGTKVDYEYARKVYKKVIDSVKSEADITITANKSRDGSSADAFPSGGQLITSEKDKNVAEVMVANDRWFLKSNDGSTIRVKIVVPDGVKQLNIGKLAGVEIKDSVTGYGADDDSVNAKENVDLGHGNHFYFHGSYLGNVEDNSDNKIDPSKIIYEIVNEDGSAYDGNITSTGATIGCIFAPEATYINMSNTAGQIFVKSISTQNAEFHSISRNEAEHTNYSVDGLYKATTYKVTDNKMSDVYTVNNYKQDSVSVSANKNTTVIAKNIVAYYGDKKPSTDKPSTDKPSTSEGDNKPSTSEDNNKPSTSEDNNKPSTSEDNSDTSNNDSNSDNESNTNSSDTSITDNSNEDSDNSLNDETEDIDGVKRNTDELDDISGTGDRSIETGDKSMLPTYAAIAGVSVLALLLLLKKRK